MGTLSLVVVKSGLRLRVKGLELGCRLGSSVIKSLSKSSFFSLFTSNAINVKLCLHVKRESFAKISAFYFFLHVTTSEIEIKVVAAEKFRNSFETILHVTRV